MENSQNQSEKVFADYKKLSREEMETLLSREQEAKEKFRENNQKGIKIKIPDSLKNIIDRIKK